MRGEAMMGKIVAAGLVLLLAVPVVAAGKLEVGVSLLPALSLTTSLTLSWEMAGGIYSSFTQFSLGTWVWQEFCGGGYFGPFSWEGHLLFGPSTVEFLYDEFILKTDFAGLSFAFYAAQLSGAVLGGPADGAALVLTAQLGEVELESLTELGARPEGIEIFHAGTGLSRKYTTDPRLSGGGLSGERLTLRGLSLCCDLSGEAELYLTKEHGFDYIKLTAGDLELWCCPVITTAIEVTFELQTKSVVITPEVKMPQIQGCFVPYLSVITDVNGLASRIEGIQVSALKLECDIGNVHLKDLTVLDRCNWAISTEDYGSELVERWRADEEGIQYHPEYWELLSVEAKGPGCCGGEWHALFNTYFGDEETLFGWGMSHLELSLPWGEAIEAELVAEFSPAGVGELSLSLTVGW
jgi:hypothetical protein